MNSKETSTAKSDTNGISNYLEEIIVPNSHHEKFLSDWYTLAKDFASKYSEDENFAKRKEIADFKQALDKIFTERIREITNQDIVTIQDIDDDDFGNILGNKQSNGLDTKVIKTINNLKMALQQVYVQKVVDKLDPLPKDFNTTPEIFCDVFKVCKFMEYDNYLTTANPNQQKINVPSSPHSKFNPDWYNIAQDIVSETSNVSKQMEIENFDKALDKIFIDGVMEITNQDISISDMKSGFEKVLSLSQNNKISKTAMEQITNLKNVLEQLYVQKVISNLEPAPKDFETSPSIFCEVFKVCRFMVTVNVTTTNSELQEINIPSSPNSKFDPDWYNIAQNIVSETSDLSKQMEIENFVNALDKVFIDGVRKITNQTISISDMKSGFEKVLSLSQNNKISKTAMEQITNLKNVLEQLYVQKVISNLEPAPKDFETSPSIFCEVFKVCRFMVTVNVTTTNSELQEINIPSSPNSKFDPDWYNIAQNIVSETSDLSKQMEIENFVNALDKVFIDGVRKITNQDIPISDMKSGFEFLSSLRQDDKLSNVEFELIINLKLVLEQTYVHKIILIFDLNPKMFNCTPEEFCEVYNICNYINASEEKGSGNSNSKENSGSSSNKNNDPFSLDIVTEVVETVTTNVVTVVMPEDEFVDNFFDSELIEGNATKSKTLPMSKSEFCALDEPSNKLELSNFFYESCRIRMNQCFSNFGVMDSSNPCCLTIVSTSSDFCGKSTGTFLKNCLNYVLQLYKVLSCAEEKEQNESGN